MRFDGYDNRGAALGAALVIAERDGAMRDGGLLQLLDDNDLPMRPDPLEAHRLEAFAREIADVFGAPPSAAAAVLNDALSRRRVVPHVSTHDGRAPHLHYEPPDADEVARIEVNTLMGLATVLCASGQDSRLGRCTARGCRAVFVDTSRNQRRTFCSSTCANRTHVAAHRVREKRT